MFGSMDPRYSGTRMHMHTGFFFFVTDGRTDSTAVPTKRHYRRKKKIQNRLTGLIDPLHTSRPRHTSGATKKLSTYEYGRKVAPCEDRVSSWYSSRKKATAARVCATTSTYLTCWIRLLVSRMLDDGRRTHFIHIYRTGSAVDSGSRAHA